MAIFNSRNIYKQSFMKCFLFCVLFILLSCAAPAQNDFRGIVKYIITSEGNNNPVTDSMSVVFSKQKVRVILYLQRPNSNGTIAEKSFIDDFSLQKSMALDEESKTYKTDNLKTSGKYEFINTGKIGAVNNMLCFEYKADSTNFNRSQISSADCLASIDYRNSSVSNYFFLGIQPVIIDNRIVMDFIVTQPDGVRQRIYVSGIRKMDDVESYFDLSAYTEIK